MTVSSVQGSEAGFDADVGGRLVDAETKTWNLNWGIWERE